MSYRYTEGMTEVITTISNCPYCEEMVTVVVGKLIYVGHSPLSDKCPYRGPAGTDQADAIRKHNDNCRIYNNIKRVQLIESREMVAIKKELSEALAAVNNLINSEEYPTKTTWLKWITHARSVKEEELCTRCHGLGWRMYEDSSVWRYAPHPDLIRTLGVCDQCWGSGVTTRTGENLLDLYTCIKELEISLRYLHPKAQTFDEIKESIERHQKLNSQGAPG